MKTTTTRTTTTITIIITMMMMMIIITNLVVTTGDDATLLERVPSKTVTFLGMALELDIRGAHTVFAGLRRMLRAIKDKHIRSRGLGGDEVGVLRHVAGTVNLALVVDLLNDFDFA